MVSSTNKQLMIIEDNEADALLIQEAIVGHLPNCAVTSYHDGAEALAALLDERTPVPDAILLDLGMPVIDGLDILTKIRNTPRLTYTPVGILTGSQAPNDKLRASLIGATCYVNKPNDYDEYVTNVREAVDAMLDSAPPAG